MELRGSNRKKGRDTEEECNMYGLGRIEKQDQMMKPYEDACTNCRRFKLNCIMTFCSKVKYR